MKSREGGQSTIDTRWMEREAKCPYYKKDKAVSISCDGLLPGANMVHYFENEQQKRSWAECACCTMDYKKRCLIARVLEDLNE